MERRDYLMAQIEQIGKVFSKILLGFKEEKIQDSIDSAIDKANSNFLNQTNVSIGQILKLKDIELKEYLKNKVLTTNHIDIIVNYLLEIVNSKYLNNENKILYLQKTLELHLVSDQLFQAISFGNNQKQAEIKEKITKLERLKLK